MLSPATGTRQKNTQMLSPMLLIALGMRFILSLSSILFPGFSSLLFFFFWALQLQFVWKMFQMANERITGCYKIVSSHLFPKINVLAVTS